MNAERFREWVGRVRAEAERVDASSKVKTCGLDYHAAAHAVGVISNHRTEFAAVVSAAFDPTFDAPKFARYVNPWHRPGDVNGGPAIYETTARPRMVAGLAIYKRLPNCWDIVRDGVCICQRAGPRGAKEAAERLGNSRKLRRKDSSK